MDLSRTAVAVVAAVLLPAAAHAYEPGRVLWAPGVCAPDCGLYDVTAGGSVDVSQRLAETAPVQGQIAWSDDLETLYVSEFGNDRIVAIGASGAAVPFATGIDGPTGLLRLADGRLLAASYHERRVVDVSAGGDVSTAPAFAEGFGRPRNLLELPGGEILLADQLRGRVYEISGGGDFSAAASFAHGFSSGPHALALDPLGRTFASTLGGVFDVSAGGDFASATPHAWGVDFIGLAVDPSGRLLAGDLASGRIYDISVPGDHSSAAPFAEAPGFGDTALAALPGAVLPASTPLARGWMVLLMAAAAWGRARRR